MTDAKDPLDALLSQREALVSFGRFALQRNDLEAVLREACRLVAETFGTELAKVLELQDGGRSLLVVAGVGWDEGVVGEERVPALARSSEGFAMNTGMPAVSEDIDTEERFDYAGFLIRHGVKAIINVVIPGPEGKAPYGLLQVDSREERDFTRSDIAFLQGYANLLAAAIERHQYQLELGKALKTSERLLQELQHRVRNNLQMVATLLKIESGRRVSPMVKQELATGIRRIETLQLVYEQLHRSGKVDEIDLGGYITSICSNLVGFEGAGKQKIRIETQAESVIVEPDLAVPLGLIANEFITNSLKHAFENQEGVISFSLHLSDEAITLELADNGRGLGSASDQEDREHSGSGLNLIEGLARQVRAELQWRSEQGTALTLKIPFSRNPMKTATG